MIRPCYSNVVCRTCTFIRVMHSLLTFLYFSLAFLGGMDVSKLRTCKKVLEDNRQSLVGEKRSSDQDTAY